MVTPISETLAQTIPFEANAAKVINLEPSGFITGIDLLLKLNVTTDATNGGTPAEDAIARILKRIQIFSGKNIYFYVRDGRILKFRNVYQFKKVKEDALPTAAGVTQDVYALYKIRLGLEPTDPFDSSVVIPAEVLPSLSLEVLWGSAADLGSGYTINSGEIKLTIYKLQLDAGEKPHDIFPEGFVEPRFSVDEIAIDQVLSDLGFERNIPVGNVLHKIWLLQLDSADNRSDEEVSEVGIKDELNNIVPYRKDWKTLQSGDMMEYGLDQEYKGVAVIDLEELSGVPIGLDTEQYKAGQLKLAFTTLKTGGKVHAVYEQLI